MSIQKLQTPLKVIADTSFERIRLNNEVHLHEAKGAWHLHQEKLKLLQSSIGHIAALWVPNGHQRFKWVLPSFCQIEQDFDRLSFKDLRKRLRTIYQRLQRERLRA